MCHKLCWSCSNHVGAKDAHRSLVWPSVELLPDEVPEVYPYAPGKGWFAFNQRGKSIHFVERLFRLLAFPNLRLKRDPTKQLHHAIRWMHPSQASRLGVPSNVFAFEVINTDLFEQEIYPQHRSGSFTKTAKKWCFQSASPSATMLPANVTKLSTKCMYLPYSIEVNGSTHPVDLTTAFRPLPEEWSGGCFSVGET